MVAVFERTTPDYNNTHTIHKAGCRDLRAVRAEDPWFVIAVEATTIEGAIDEAAAQDRLNDFEPEVRVMPCAKKAAAGR